MSEESTQAGSGEPQPEINKRVMQYIKLRDLIKKEDDDHAERMKQKKTLLVALNNAILEHFNTHGGDSVTIRGVGTAYKTTKDSATIADGEEFKRWVIGGGLWEMADWRASVTGTREYIEKNNAPPPGVNFRSTVVVGVRRAS